MKNLALFIAFMLFFVSTQAQTFINYAQGKPVTTSWKSKNTELLTDGSLISGSFRSDPKGESVAIDIDLTAEFKLGGIHLYFDTSINTLPATEFSFQYKNNGEWVNIPGTSRTQNFSSQIEIKFPEVISTGLVRMIANDVTSFGILEIQIWGTDVPSIPYGVEITEQEPFTTNKHWVCANQVAYNLKAPKSFTVPTATKNLSFVLKEKESGKVVFKGKLKNGKGIFTDFNPTDSEGKEYLIHVEGDSLESADPSGDLTGEKLHSQTIEQFAYFLYGYPAYKKYIAKEFYQMVLDSTLKWWAESGLFKVDTIIGSPKGRMCPGHSIMPNLLMYEVARREKLENPEKYMKSAYDQTQWIIDYADWNNPSFTKGQRISEHKLVTGLAHFQANYSDLAPAGLKQKLIDWAEKAVSLSDNMWDFRKFDKEVWTLPGYNEAGNVIAFPGAALSVAMVLDEGKIKDRLVELAYSHYDNFCGRNPQNAHCANHPDNGFEGVERGWPYGDSRRDICARLENVRGSLSSLPGSEMYPFNPNGKPRWGEGWTAYNADWNVSLAYLNFYEGVSSVSVLKYCPSK